MSRIVREDLMSKSQFSKAYEITRVKLDALIKEDLLDIENIAGIDYININNREVISQALSHRGEGRGKWSRKTINRPYVSKSPADRKFDEAYEEYMREVDKE